MSARPRKPKQKTPRPPSPGGLKAPQPTTQPVAWGLAALALVVLGAGYLSFYPANDTPFAEVEGDQEAAGTTHPGVVIIAQGRSGSSFFGSWFNVTDDMLYFVEPCAAPFSLNFKGLTGTDCGRRIDDMLDCDFREVGPDKTKYQNKGVEEFTGWGNQTHIGNCARRTKVIKEIRLGPWALGPEHKAFKEQAKTIILLRDPRAVYASRLKNWLPPAQDEPEGHDYLAGNPTAFSPSRRVGYPYAQSIKQMCFEQVELHKTAQVLGPEKVMLVRYDDLQRFPFETARRVFDFIDLPLPDQVVDHIEKHITGKCTFLGKPFSVCRETRVDELANAKDDKWMSVLTDEQVKYAETVCKEALKLHGLETVSDS